MSKCRFMYENKITSPDMITVSSSYHGVIGSAYEEKLGSATLNISGNYTASDDKGYVIEIDDVSAGKEIGQATFRWSDTDGASWNATGVTTSASGINLSNGVTISFTAGSGDDFELSDKWTFICKNNYGKQKMIDLDRDYVYRSRSLDNPNTITIDLGSNMTIDVVLILDHNLTSAAKINLKANTVNDLDNPCYCQLLTWNEDKIGYYPGEYGRYWQIEIYDEANPDGYIEIGELYLGSYKELTRNFSYDWEQISNYFETIGVSKKGVDRRILEYAQEGLNLSFKYVSSADVAKLKTMMDALRNVSTGVVKPVFFNLASDTPNEFWLVYPNPEFRRTNPYNGLYNINLELKERVKSRV